MRPFAMTRMRSQMPISSSISEEMHSTPEPFFARSRIRL